MFEDRRAIRRRRFIVAALFITLAAAAFSYGYFMNIGSVENMAGPENRTGADLKIPDKLLNPIPTAGDAGDNEEDTETGEAVGFVGIDIVSPNTNMVFRTRFTLCGHAIEKNVLPTEDEVNMTEAQLQEKYAEWELKSFSTRNAVFEKTIATLCPKHFILGVDNGYIAVYVYNENGEKILKERTEISVATLPPEDQKSLESGIIADTEDDLDQKLEGFSD